MCNQQIVLASSGLVIYKAMQMLSSVAYVQEKASQRDLCEITQTVTVTRLD